MDRRSFLKTTGVVAAQAAVFQGRSVTAAPQQPEPSPLAPVNPFERQGQWYKAALHVHTTTSDGDVDVPTRIAQYRKLRYDVVAITDHWKTNDLSGLSDETFLALCGMEAHPPTGTGAPRHHLVCLDLPHPFELDQDQPAQELADKVRSTGGKIVYAHPYWTAHTLEEMSEIGGYIALEVFNGVCQARRGKGFANVHWDQLLNKGQIVAAMAVDDVHNSDELDMGWTMIKAVSLGRSEVADAIAQGSYYASCGPQICDCRIEDGTIRIQTSPAAQIRFLFDGAGAGRTFNAEKDGTIVSAQWRFGGERRRPKWIRAEVTDRRGKFAWTNPMLVGDDPRAA